MQYSMSMRGKIHPIAYFAALLFLVLGVTAPCSASPYRIPSVTSVLDRSWVVADFDGDHSLDFAGIDRLSQLDIALGSAERQHLAVVEGGDVLGLQISAADVDGDNDLDIVISRRLLGTRVAVWLNDGHGAFTEVSPEQYPQTGIQARDSEIISSPGSDADVLRVRNKDGRVDASSTVLDAPKSHSLKIRDGGFAFYRSQQLSSIHLLRGPPASLAY